ncbi:MAG: ATP-binding protein, partial [Candidatus Methanoperedens sp.]
MAIKALVVDDNKNDRMLLREMLAAKNYEVIEAGDGAEALEYVKVSRPDIIISDIMMPVMDGFKLLRELKKDERTKDIPVVIYTSYYVSEKDMKLAQKLGASRYIIKPIESRKLLNEIETVLREYEAGLVKLAEPIIETEEEYLSKYCELQVKKLEETLCQLEAEISRRKQTEEKLRKSEAKMHALVNTLRESETKYQRLVEQIPAVVYMSPPDNFASRIYVSPRVEALSGYSQEEWLTDIDLWGKLLHPDDMQDVFVKVSEGFKEKISQEYRIITRSGDVVWVRDEAIVANDAAGRPLYIQGIMQDITENKKTETMQLENQRLIAASKTKSDFLANMSHELRTPLNAIIGFSELLEMKIPGELNEKQNRFVNDILVSGRHLMGLINDILDLSKVEAGKIELVIEKIPVADAINEGLILVKEKAKRHNIALKVELDPYLKFIEADIQRFKQILFNLLDNAVKFSKKDGGTVTITAKKEGNMAKFSVSDTGIGIKEENLVRLFREFEQIDSGISRKYGGTGLGLSITKKLVELHGGKISVKSRYGEGSTFT